MADADAVELAVTADRASWHVWIPVLALVVAAGVCNAAAVTSAFGDSHDGRNAAMWATGTRAIRQDGLVDSRLGGVHDDGLVYAHHPPLIYLETAAAESVLGEHRWVTRAPAWLGSVVSVGLLLLILRRAGFPAHVAAAAVAVALSSAMFLVYGSMLDTPIVAFPFALGFVLQLQRHPTGHWTIGLLASLACLAAWQAFVIVAVGPLLIGPRIPRRSLMWAWGGAAVAAALVLLWQWWVFGSLGPVADVALARTGIDSDAYGGRSSLAGAARNQARSLYELLSPVAIVAAVAGLVLARRHDAARLLLVGLLAVLGYSAVTSAGAYFHDYWQYWILFPVAVAAAIALNALPVRPSVLVMLAVGGVLAGALMTSATWAHQARHAGLDAVELARSDEYAADVLSVGEPLWPPTRWLTYELGRPPGDEVSRMERPGAVWLDHTWRLEQRHPSARIVERRGSYVLLVENEDG